MTDERTGKTWDYSRHFGGAGAMLLTPANTPEWLDDRQALWNQVEAIEPRKDAMLARDIILTMPYGLSNKQMFAAAAEFAREQFVSKGKPVDIGLHIYGEPWGARAEATKGKIEEWKEKKYPFFDVGNVPPDYFGPHIAIERYKNGNPKNYYLKQPHIHMQTPFRAIDPASPTAFSAKKDTVTKDNWYTEDRAYIKQLRKDWADTLNRHLEKAGLSERVDHRSLKDRGIDHLKPEPKKGPVAAKMEREDRGHEAKAIIDWHKVKQSNSIAQRLLQLDSEIVYIQQERRKRMTPEEQQAETQRQAIDARVASQLEQIERFTELRREGDRIKSTFEADQEEARKLEERRLYQRTAGSDVTDARTRWLEAVADSPRQQEWDKALASAVGIEGARAKREHDNLTREAAVAQNPDQKKDILYRRDIQFYDYMAITEERQVGISRGITGYTQRRDLNGPDIMDTEGERQKRPWEIHADQSREWREKAAELRQEREQHQERMSWRELDEINRNIEKGGERINGGIKPEVPERPRTVRDEIAASQSDREEMTDARKEKSPKEQTDQTKENKSSRGQRWNAEEREIRQMERDAERGRGDGGMSR